MPIYEYQCYNTECMTRTEIFYSIVPNDIPISEQCDHCKGMALRIVSQSSFRLKGDGWPGKELKQPAAES